MHQKCNSGHDHATRFFDGITSFFSMLHSFLIAFRKTLHTTINQLITKNIENLFFKDKRELEKSLLKEKNKIIMNQKLQEKCKRSRNRTVVRGKQDVLRGNSKKRYSEENNYGILSE